MSPPVFCRECQREIPGYGSRFGYCCTCYERKEDDDE